MKYTVFTLVCLLSVFQIIAQELPECSSSYAFQQSSISDASGNNIPIVIVEFEHIPNRDQLNGWEFRTDVLKQQDSSDFPTSYSGEGYLYYNGDTKYRDGGYNVIEYKIRIDEPGAYRFIYASAIGIFATEKSPSTEHNDAWVKFPDADAFYGYKQADNTIAIPNDIGLSSPDPNDAILKAEFPEATYKFPDGSNEKNAGYFKVYMNQLDDWWYEGSTSDSDAHEVFVRFDNPGLYTMLISGRSTGFCLDRAVLWKEEGDLIDLNNRIKRKDAFKNLDSTTPVCEDQVPPTITSAINVSLEENNAGNFYTASADEDVTFTLGTSKDEALFSINVDSLSFLSAPDFEAPKDSDADNKYLVDIIATDIDGNSSSKELTIEVTDVNEQVLGVDDLINAFNIYPNPVSEFLSIETEKSIEQVFLISMDGRVVHQEEAINVIDVSDISNGAYVLRIKTREGDLFKHIIVNH